MHNNSLCTAANAEAVLSFLRDRGILEDDGATPQHVEEKKRKQAYHNTLLLLTNYRSILWQTESELESVAAELNLPLRKLGFAWRGWLKPGSFWIRSMML